MKKTRDERHLSSEAAGFPLNAVARGDQSRTSVSILCAYDLFDYKVIENNVVSHQNKKENNGVELRRNPNLRELLENVNVNKKGEGECVR